RAGRLEAFEADPGDGQDLAGARLHRDDAAELPAERRDRGLLDGGGDGRADGPRGLRGPRGERLRAGEELSSRSTAEPVVERPLEPADPDLCFWRDAFGFQFVAPRVGDRPDFPDDRAP